MRHLSEKLIHSIKNNLSPIILPSFSKIEDCREATIGLGDRLREGATIVILKGPLHPCFGEAKQSRHTPILLAATSPFRVRNLILLSETTGISD